MGGRTSIAVALAASLIAFSTLSIQPARAVPPAAMGATGLAGARWVKHRVIPGERIAEIAEYYGVRAHQIVKWNKLDPKRPMIRVGQHLRMWSRSTPLERERIRYVVKRGDSWSKIAKNHDVDVGKLRKRWNSEHGKALRAGETIVVWVEQQEPEPETVDGAGDDEGDGAQATGEQDAAQLPTVDVRDTSLSIGSPSRGRLSRGLRMPDNPELYTLRKPEHSYGSSHTVENLQQAIASFRKRTAFEGELVIADMSRKRGGRFRPHRSHRSGRDVDVRLPLAAGVAKGTVPQKMTQVDWDATWALIQSLLDTGQVDYIFLNRSRQRALRQAARRAGVSDADLERLIQFPTYKRVAVIRHSRGHTKHFHVRFKCSPDNTRCRD